MDPLDQRTQNVFKRNRLAGFYNYVKSGEVVPHFFSRGSYYLSRDESRCSLRGHVNSCMHRGFKLVTERRQLKQGQPITCKFHNWTYDAKDGNILTTPGFTVLGSKVHGCLKEIPLVDVGNGMFFEADSVRFIDHIRQMFKIPGLEDVWVNDYVFDQENVTFYQCNWRTILEVYLDMYHHKSANPKGLGMFLTEKDIIQVSGTVWTASICQMNTGVPTSFGWSKFKEQIDMVGWDKPWGAIFCTIFPGLMLEFFPYTMVVSQLVPLSDKMTANYLQIYYDPIVAQNFDFQNAFSDAYTETASEDGALFDLLEDGRMASNAYVLRTLPTHSMLEVGIQDFNDWLFTCS